MMALTVLILLILRSLIIWLAIGFFFVISVYAAFYDEFAISQSTALITIALLLVKVIDAIKEKK